MAPAFAAAPAEARRVAPTGKRITAVFHGYPAPVVTTADSGHSTPVTEKSLSPGHFGSIESFGQLVSGKAEVLEALGT